MFGQKAITNLGGKNKIQQQFQIRCHVILKEIVNLFGGGQLCAIAVSFPSVLRVKGPGESENKNLFFVSREPFLMGKDVLSKLTARMYFIVFKRLLFSSVRDGFLEYVLSMDGGLMELKGQSLLRVADGAT